MMKVKTKCNIKASRSHRRRHTAQAVWVQCSLLQLILRQSFRRTHEHEFRFRWSHSFLSHLPEHYWGLRCRWATFTIESIEINKHYLNKSICRWIGAVICYYGSWAKNRPSNGKFAIEDINPKYCSIIIYCCIGLNEDGTIRPYDAAGMNAREINENEKYSKKREFAYLQAIYRNSFHWKTRIQMWNC